MEYSTEVIEDAEEYYLYAVDLDLDAGETVSDLRDGAVEDQRVSLPVQIKTGGQITVEDVGFEPAEPVIATNGYAALREKTVHVFLWKSIAHVGDMEGQIYSVPYKYFYDPRNHLDPYREYAAYAESSGFLGTLRAKLGRTVAPLVDNAKQSALSGDWLRVLRDDQAIEVELTVDGTIKVAVAHVSVELHLFLIVEEEYQGELREVVKKVTYAPPFPITGDGAHVDSVDGVSVVAPRCDTLDELTTKPLYIPID